VSLPQRGACGITDFQTANEGLLKGGFSRIAILGPLRKQAIFIKRVILDVIYTFRDSVMPEYEVIGQRSAEKNENIAVEFFLILYVFGVDSIFRIEPSSKDTLMAEQFWLFYILLDATCFSFCMI